MLVVVGMLVVVVVMMFAVVMIMMVMVLLMIMVVVMLVVLVGVFVGGGGHGWKGSSGGKMSRKAGAEKFATGALAQGNGSSCASSRGAWAASRTSQIVSTRSPAGRCRK